MKRLFLLPALTAAVLLLSACPDTKLPSPTPKVPEPKAQTTTFYDAFEISDLNRSADPLSASRHS